MNFRNIVFISILFLFSFSAYPQANSQDFSDPSFSQQVKPQRQIFENDKILINIRKVPELSGGFNVDQAGMVNLELIGKVRAAGLRPHEFEKVLTQLYGRDYLQDPFIRIELVDSFRAEDIAMPEILVTPEATASEGDEFADDFLYPKEDEAQSSLDAVSNPANPNPNFVPIEDFFANETNTVVEIPLEVPAKIIDSGPLVQTEPVMGTMTAEIFELPLQTFETFEPVKNDFTLVETNWTFESDPRAFIQFLGDGKIAGFTGCNNFFATYTFEDNLVSIQFVASTFNECYDVKDGEFQVTLESIETFQYSEPNKLMLLDTEDEVVLTLLRGFSTIQGN